MTPLQFTPEEIYKVAMDDSGLGAGAVAIYVNQRIDKWLSEAVRVYGRHGDGWASEQDKFSCKPGENWKTHQALLVAIEPIKREPCVHEPQPVHFSSETLHIAKDFQIDLGKYAHQCKHCGIALVAKWEVRDE